MCCRALARWLCGLCGPSRARPATKEDVESQERLLAGQRSSSATGVADAAAHDVHAPALAPASPDAPTTLIVMRHGHRQDEEDPFWHSTASRPWDPPLSVKGKLQAKAVAGAVAQHRVDLVVSSPFRRCLQTSAGLVRGLGTPAGRWLVNWQLSEVCDPRVLFASRSDARSAAAQHSIAAWMWGGASLADALRRFVSDDCRLEKVPIPPLPYGSQPPPFPESLEQGLQRYALALQDIARTYTGRTVLVVTHGECVRAAVLLAEPHSEVFEVKHTGYVVLQQQQQAQTQQGQEQEQQAQTQQGQEQEQQQGVRGWRLTSEPGETGVLWLEDDE